MPGRTRDREVGSSQQALAPLVLLFLVSATALVASSSADLVENMASSPRQVGHGQVWRLVTSGMLVERPLAASIISFALLAYLVLFVCGARVLWISALVGHVGSALVPYSVIALARLQDPGAFQGAWSSSDYGVSAVSAAWLGGLAATGWRFRGATWLGRSAIALSCCAVTVFAYSLRPGLTILASEHLVAFFIGITTARVLCDHAAVSAQMREARAALAVAAKLARAIVRRSRWLRSVDPVVVGALFLTILLVGGSILPSALGALGHRLLHERASVPRCSIARAYGDDTVAPAAAMFCQTMRENARG